MKPKTPGEVIKVLKRDIRDIRCSASAYSQPLTGVNLHEVDCLQRAIAIVRLWDAGITPADVRKSGRKGRAKK